MTPLPAYTIMAETLQAALNILSELPAKTTRSVINDIESQCLQQMLDAGKNPERPAA